MGITTYLDRLVTVMELNKSYSYGGHGLVNVVSDALRPDGLMT